MVGLSTRSSQWALCGQSAVLLLAQWIVVLSSSIDKMSSQLLGQGEGVSFTFVKGLFANGGGAKV